MLFALYSVLCPPGGVHINLEFLFSLTDVKIIKLRNWASFCFGKLMDGITRYKEEKLAYVGGCLLYLQVNMFTAQVIFFFFLFNFLMDISCRSWMCDEKLIYNPRA